MCVCTVCVYCVCVCTCALMLFVCLRRCAYVPAADSIWHMRRGTLSTRHGKYLNNNNIILIYVNNKDDNNNAVPMFVN